MKRLCRLQRYFQPTGFETSAGNGRPNMKTAVILEKTKKENQKVDLSIMSDEELFAASKTNPIYFEELINRYKTSFIRKIGPVFRDLLSMEDAEDVVQDTFVKIYIKAHLFESRGPGSFRAWSYKILLNTAQSALRKSAREKKLPLDDYLELPEAESSHQTDEWDKKFSLDRALFLLSRLPQTLKRTAELYFVKGRSYAEIAASENVSESAARVRIHRVREAINKLADELNA